MPSKYTEISNINTNKRYKTFNQQIKIFNCLQIFEEMIELLELYYKQKDNLRIAYAKMMSEKDSDNTINFIPLETGIWNSPSAYLERLENGIKEEKNLKNSLFRIIKAIELYNNPSKQDTEKQKKL